MHVYEVRPRSDNRGVDLISDVLPFGGLWYGDANAVANAIGYAQFYSRSHDAVIRVYDAAGNVIETHQHKGDFKEWECRAKQKAAVRRSTTAHCFGGLVALVIIQNGLRCRFAQFKLRAHSLEARGKRFNLLF